jgi:hypothetical protein
MRKLKTPTGLKKRGMAFWKQTNREFVFEERHIFERLEMAAKCLDEIADAEAAIKKDGLFITDRYGSLREHPGVKVCRDNRTLFCRIIRELGLDLTTGPDSKIPAKY